MEFPPLPPPPKSRNPAGRSEVWRPDIRKSVPALCCPCALWGANWIPKVSLEGAKSDQLLQHATWSQAASRPHTFEVRKVLPIKEEAGAPPWAAPSALTLPGGHLLLQGLCGRWYRQEGGRRGLGCSSLPWPRDRLPLWPLFPTCCSSRPQPEPPPPRGPRLTSASNTWLRGSPARSFLGAYSLTWEERGTERLKGDRGWRLGVCSPAQLSRGGGWSSGGRRRSSGGPVGVRRRGGLCPPRSPRLRSGASRRPATTALRRPAPRSGQVRLPLSRRSPAPGRRARPRHTPACARTRAIHPRVHTRVNAGGLRANPRLFGGLGTSHW